MYSMCNRHVCCLHLVWTVYMCVVRMPIEMGALILYLSKALTHFLTCDKFQRVLSFCPNDSSKCRGRQRYHMAHIWTGCRFFDLIVNVSFMSVSTRRIPEALMLHVINEDRPFNTLKPFSSNRTTTTTTGRINSRLKWTPYARLLRLLRYISHGVKFTPLFRRETHIYTSCCCCC